MSSLKSFLFGVAPILMMTPAALYERQRALVKLGELKVAPGRGPGSGVPLTAENVAAIVISVLAAETLAEVDEQVIALCKAKPEGQGSISRIWTQKGKPTFKSEVALVLSGKNAVCHSAERPAHYYGIRVSRCWRGQIVKSPSGANPLVYRPDITTGPLCLPGSISITAEIEDETLSQLIAFTRGALSQVGDGDDE